MPRGRKRGPTKGRRLRDGFTKNCFFGKHKKCFSLNCVCDCHYALVFKSFNKHIQEGD